MPHIIKLLWFHLYKAATGQILHASPGYLTSVQTCNDNSFPRCIPSTWGHGMSSTQGWEMWTICLFYLIFFYCLLHERQSACHTLSCFLPPFFAPCLQGEYCLLTLLHSSASTDTLLCLRGSLSLLSVVCLFTILCTKWVRNIAYSSCAFILIVTAVSSKDALLLCAVLHVKPAKEATRSAVSRDTCRDNAEGTMAQSNVEKTGSQILHSITRLRAACASPRKQLPRWRHEAPVEAKWHAQFFHCTSGEHCPNHKLMEASLNANVNHSQ